MAAFARKHPALSYYVVTFGVSWGAILLIVGPPGFLPTTSTTPAFAVAGFAAVLGPAISGVLPATAPPQQSVMALLAFGAELWLAVGVLTRADRKAATGLALPSTPRAIAA